MLKKIGVGLATLGAVAAGVYLLFIRPWHLRWGATNEEVHHSMPGDDLVTRVLTESTRAITINAPAEMVWPWLVQIGQGRGGFYSYDWLENLLGLDIHSADRILSEYQSLVVGDLVQLAPGSGMTVALIEPGQLLVLHETFDPLTGRMIDRTAEHPGRFVDGSWAWLLKGHERQTTRLLTRFRADLRPTFLGRPFLALLEPIIFMMEHKMLLGIKQRAEKGRKTL
jgi:hypothetical protein